MQNYIQQTGNAHPKYKYIVITRRLPVELEIINGYDVFEI